MKITLHRQGKKVTMKCEGEFPVIHRSKYSSGSGLAPLMWFSWIDKIWFGKLTFGMNQHTFDTIKQAKESMKHTTEAAIDLFNKAGKKPKIKHIHPYYKVTSVTADGGIKLSNTWDDEPVKYDENMPEYIVVNKTYIGKIRRKK